jgi:hypothetical protein
VRQPAALDDTFECFDKAIMSPDALPRHARPPGKSVRGLLLATRKHR